MPIIFTTLDDPSAVLNDPVLVKGTAARGINGAGQIVGLFSDNNSRPNHGFLFSGGSFTTIDNPSASTITDAFGINDAGQIVGFFNNASGIHGFLRSGTTFTTLDAPMTTHGTEALGINNAGTIVGSFSDATGAPTAFSATAAATSPPSTIPRPLITPRCTASTTQARSSGNTRTPPAPPTVSC